MNGAIAMDGGTDGETTQLRRVVGAVLGLNLVDALLTLAWVELGVAREANPLLAGLLALSPALFVAAKSALVSLGLGLLFLLRQRRMAVLGIWSALGLYLLVLGIHLHGASRVITFTPTAVVVSVGPSFGEARR